MLSRRRLLSASAVAVVIASLFNAPSAHSTLGFLGGSSASSILGPDITALPEATTASEPWQAFINATGGQSGWAINTAFTDPTSGVALRRVTNRSTISGGPACAMEYTEGGPRISQQLSGGYYWIQFNTPSGRSVLKYQLGVGVVASSVFNLPNLAGGNLGWIFSQLSGEENIGYYADNSGLIHRYDCSLQAYASNSVFNGTNASITINSQSLGWMQGSWDGTRIVFQSPFTGGSAAGYAAYVLDPQTGTLESYSGSVDSDILLIGGTSTSGSTTTVLNDSSRSWESGDVSQWNGATIYMTSGAASGQSASVSANTATSITHSGFTVAPSAGDTYSIFNVNELHTLKGSTNAVALLDNYGGIYFWFPESGVCTARTSVSYSSWGGHVDGGANYIYSSNPQLSYADLEEHTAGTAPGSDGGAWNGSQYDYWGSGPTTNIGGGQDGHFNTAWNQLGAAAGNEWVVRDDDGPYYNKNSAAGWSVYSGSIYETTVNFGSGYGNPSRGVTGVTLWNGTVGSGSQITGSLTAAASLGAMTAGTYYWNGTTLYVWMPGGIAPTATNNIIESNSINTANICYFKSDGSDIRQLCWTYSEYQDTGANYANEPFVNISPDGLIAVFNSDLGTYNGYVDLVVAELPT